MSVGGPPKQSLSPGNDDRRQRVGSGLWADRMNGAGLMSSLFDEADIARCAAQTAGVRAGGFTDHVSAGVTEATIRTVAMMNSAICLTSGLDRYQARRAAGQRPPVCAFEGTGRAGRSARFPAAGGARSSDRAPQEIGSLAGPNPSSLRLVVIHRLSSVGTFSYQKIVR